VLGLLGVVVGALAAFLGQFLLRRTERQEFRRNERLDACADFVRAAETARAAQYDRWWSKHEGRPTDAHAAAKRESFGQRTALKVARSRLRLLGITGVVLQRADDILAAVADLHHAGDRPAMQSEGDRIREMIDAFSDSASELFR
jgi:hypothetical protein